MKPHPFVAWLAIAVAAPCVVPAPSAARPYLGQSPPGTTPRVFAPGVVSTGDLHGRLTISPDGRELFWTTVDTTTFSTRLMSVRERGGRWTRPEPPPFAVEGSAQSPMFSPDGKRLYFLVHTGQGWATRHVERVAAGWSAARSDGVLLDCSSSFTRSGRAYLSSTLPTKAWGSGIFSATLTGEGITGLAPLDSVINVPGAIDYTPFVSPDESFLLFSSNRPQVGDREDMHVHVSFRSRDGRWSAPRRLSEIAGRFPSLSPDGRYLFFCGDDGNIWWVEAKVIEALRPAGGR